jgi:hypothetical protein
MQLPTPTKGSPSNADGGAGTVAADTLTSLPASRSEQQREKFFSNNQKMEDKYLPKVFNILNAIFCSKSFFIVFYCLIFFVQFLII